MSRSELALLHTLISRCDVLVQNLKPGVMDKLGLSLEQLHKRFPGLISVSIAGFHPHGPGAARKAYDLLMQAEAGLASITGSAEAPGRVGVSLVDIATGMFAYEAILEALLVRHQTGVGEQIHVSLFDAVAQWMSVPYLLSQYGGAAPQRIGLAHPGICPYGVFVAADGKNFVLSIQNEAEWRRLCEVGVGLPQLLHDKRCINNETRVANRSFVDLTLSDHFATARFIDIESRLNDADLAFAPVNSVADLATHADLRTVDVRLEGAQVSLPVMPGRSANVNAEQGLKVPVLGEHTRSVVAWLNDV